MPNPSDPFNLADLIPIDPAPLDTDVIHIRLYSTPLDPYRRTHGSVYRESMYREVRDVNWARSSFQGEWIVDHSLGASPDEAPGVTLDDLIDNIDEFLAEIKGDE